MTKEELFKLTKIKAEIEQLHHQISNIEPEHSIDMVTGSSIEFPYTKHPIKLEGYDYVTYEARVNRIRSRLTKKLTELAEEKDKLTEYIYNLSDSDLRQIFVYRYIDGCTWDEVADKMNYATITVRVKHDKLLKNIS